MAQCWLDSRFSKIKLSPRLAYTFDNANNLISGFLTKPRLALNAGPVKGPSAPNEIPAGSIDLAITQGDKWRRSNGNPPSGWDATPEGKAAAAMFGPNSPLRFDYWDMATPVYQGEASYSDVWILIHSDGSVTYFPPVTQANVGVTDVVFCAPVFFTYAVGEVPSYNPAQQLAWQASVNVSNPTPTNPQTLVVTPRSKTTPTPAASISASIFASSATPSAYFAPYQAPTFVQDAGPPPLIGDLLTAAEAMAFQRQQTPLVQQAPPTYEVVRAAAPMVPTWAKAVAGGLALLALGGGVYLIAKE